MPHLWGNRRRPLDFSVKYKFLICFFTVIIIPFISMGCLIYINANHEIQKSVLSIQQYKLDRLSYYFDFQFMKMAESSYDLAVNKLFAPSVPNSVVEELDKIKLLNDVASGMELCGDIALYAEKENAIYTSEGKYIPEVYFSRVICLPNWKTVFGIGQTRQDWVTFQDQFTGEAYLAYAPRLEKYNSSYLDAVIFYLMPYSQIGYYANAISGGLDGTLCIYQGSGALLLDLSQGFAAKVPPELLEHTENQPYGFRADGQDCVAMKRTSEETQFKIVIYSQKDVFWKANTDFLTSANWLALGVLLVSACFGIGFSYLNYRPIAKLTAKFQNGSLKKKNELARIEGDISEMLSNNDSLREEISEQKRFLLDHILTTLLHEGGGEELLRRLKLLDFSGDNTSLFLVLLRPIRTYETDRKNRDKLLAPLEALRYDPLLWRFQEENGEDLILLFRLDRTDPDAQQTACKTVLEYFQREGIMVSLACSGVKNDLCQLNSLYLQARICLEMSAKDCAVSFYDKLSETNPVAFWYPVEPMQMLMESIKNANTSAALESLRSLLDQTHAKCGSLLIEKCVCSDVVNGVIKKCKMYNIPLKLDAIAALSQCPSIDTLCARMEELIPELCEHTRLLRLDQQNKVTGEIVKYVDEHYLDNSLSLEMVADAFSMTPQYISRIFKAGVGIGFKEYAITLRMEEAKRRLTQTGESVANISDQIGYINPSHFIKIFKSYVGLTPAEFRKTNGGA